MGVDGNSSFTKRYRANGARLAAPPPDEHAALQAANGLSERYSEQSAHIAVTLSQARMAGRLVLIPGLIGLLWPEGLLIAFGGLASVLFAAILLWRAALVWRGVALMGEKWAQVGDMEGRAADGDLPIYTLLIALYDEAGTAAQLARAIRGLDYPQHKLDVKLLIEVGDEVTEAALRAERWPEQTELLALPNGTPRTKPRALNYGLARARGEFVVVYDAEDRPDAQQLREAVAAFRGPAVDWRAFRRLWWGRAGRKAGRRGSGRWNTPFSSVSFCRLWRAGTCRLRWAGRAIISGGAFWRPLGAGTRGM